MNDKEIRPYHHFTAEPQIGEWSGGANKTSRVAQLAKLPMEITWSDLNAYGAN